MAFGINKAELENWKRQVLKGEIAFLTHYWQDERFPNTYTVTKVGCVWIPKLINWGKQYDLKAKWIHQHPLYPHFDLLGERQLMVLQQEGRYDHIKRFHL